MKFCTSVLLLVVSLHTCLAVPASNRTTRYECLTGDACRSQSSGSCTLFQSRLSCCQSGDEITFSYNKPGSSFSSSFVGPCRTPAQHANETAQQLGSGGSASVNVVESGVGSEALAYNCSCQAVDSFQIYWGIHQKATDLFYAILDDMKNAFNRFPFF